MSGRAFLERNIYLPEGVKADDVDSIATSHYMFAGLWRVEVEMLRGKWLGNGRQPCFWGFSRDHAHERAARWIRRGIPNRSRRDIEG